MANFMRHLVRPVQISHLCRKISTLQVTSNPVECKQFESKLFECQKFQLKHLTPVGPSTRNRTQDRNKRASNLIQNNNWIYRENDGMIQPETSSVIYFPNNGLGYIPPNKENEEKGENRGGIVAPGVGKEEKRAARLIVIRRKKMKKHKLRKLRKRMKYEWAKQRQRRELKKEKAFQAELVNQCKTAEAFSAEKYVQDKIDKLNEVQIPRFWKGRRLPEFIIREKLGMPPK